MPDVRVTHPHSLPVDEAKARLVGFSELLGKYGVRLDWSGPVARVAGLPGVSGTIEVTKVDVRVAVSVSRMITMMGVDPARLEASVRKRLTEALPPAA